MSTECKLDYEEVEKLTPEQLEQTIKAWKSERERLLKELNDVEVNLFYCNMVKFGF